MLVDGEVVKCGMYHKMYVLNSMNKVQLAFNSNKAVM